MIDYVVIYKDHSSDHEVAAVVHVVDFEKQNIVAWHDSMGETVGFDQVLELLPRCDFKARCMIGGQGKVYFSGGLGNAEVLRKQARR